MFTPLPPPGNFEGKNEPESEGRARRAIGDEPTARTRPSVVTFNHGTAVLCCGVVV